MYTLSLDLSLVLSPIFSHSHTHTHLFFCVILLAEFVLYIVRRARIYVCYMYTLAEWLNGWRNIIIIIFVVLWYFSMHTLDYFVTSFVRTRLRVLIFLCSNDNTAQRSTIQRIYIELNTRKKVTTATTTTKLTVLSS